MTSVNLQNDSALNSIRAWCNKAKKTSL